MTMAKKLTSCSGMRSYMRSKARDSGTPTLCCSTRSMNSLLTGSGDSVAMICRQSESGETGFDAAHDDVDGVGKLVEELGLTALGHAREDPAWQSKAADEGHE